MNVKPYFQWLETPARALKSHPFLLVSLCFVVSLTVLGLVVAAFDSLAGFGVAVILLFAFALFLRSWKDARDSEERRAERRIAEKANERARKRQALRAQLPAELPLVTGVNSNTVDDNEARPTALTRRTEMGGGNAE